MGIHKRVQKLDFWLRRFGAAENPTFELICVYGDVA